MVVDPSHFHGWYWSLSLTFDCSGEKSGFHLPRVGSFRCSWSEMSTSCRVLIERGEYHHVNAFSLGFKSGLRQREGAVHYPRGAQPRLQEEGGTRKRIAPKCMAIDAVTRDAPNPGEPRHIRPIFGVSEFTLLGDLCVPIA
jgi:hypothetical protein